MRRCLNLLILVMASLVPPPRVWVPLKILDFYAVEKVANS
jgi:hypothetical protein